MNFIKRLFVYLFSNVNSTEYQLEAYLKDKNPQSVEELNMWLAEFDNERSIRNRAIALG